MESNEQDKLMNKIGPEARIIGTHWQISEWGCGGKWKRLAKEYICIAPGQRQQYGEGWGSGTGRRGALGGERGTSAIVSTIT